MVQTLSTEIGMKSFVATQQLYTIPNLVTLGRVVGLPPFVLLSADAQHTEAVWARWATMLLYGLIVGSDMLDGWLARRLGQTSALGRTLDHVSDVVCILTALGAFVVRGVVPWWLPAAIAWAFGLYVLDSWWRTARQPYRQLLSSRLGHLGGILYYVTVGIVALHVCTDGHWFPPRFLPLWYLCLAALALFSGAERLVLLLHTRRRSHAAHPPECLPPRNC
jgi:phosphatidylglycerophosphate synthase